MNGPVRHEGVVTSVELADVVRSNAGDVVAGTTVVTVEGYWGTAAFRWDDPGVQLHDVFTVTLAQQGRIPSPVTPRPAASR